PGNPRFVTASEDSTITIWRLHQTGRPEVLDCESPVRVVACAPEKSLRPWCLAGCANGTIYLWDLDNPAKAVHKIEGKHSDGVSALAFSPDGAWFASGGQDNSITLWDTAAGKEKYTFDFEHGVLDPHQGTITLLAFT